MAKLSKDRNLLERIFSNLDVTTYFRASGKLKKSDNLDKSEFNECIAKYKSSSQGTPLRNPIDQSDLNTLTFARYQEVFKYHIITDDISSFASLVDFATLSKREIDESGSSPEQIQEIIKFRNDCNEITINQSVETLKRIEKFSDKSLKEKLKNGQIDKDASQKIKDSYKNLKTKITELSSSDDSLALFVLLLSILKGIEILDIAEKNIDKPLMKALVNLEENSNYTKKNLRDQKELCMAALNIVCSCTLEFEDGEQSLDEYIEEKKPEVEKAVDDIDWDTIKNCSQIITRGYILKTENKKIINLFAKFEQNLDVFKAEVSILDEEFKKNNTEHERYNDFKFQLKEFETTRNKYVEAFQDLEGTRKDILEEIRELKKNDPMNNNDFINNKNDIEHKEQDLKDLKFDENINTIITNLETLNKDIDNYLYNDEKGPKLSRDNFLIRFFKAIWEMISKLWDNPEKELYDKGKEFNFADTELSRIEEEEEKQEKQTETKL